MMNIRDFIFINKAKSSNKVRILDILGFDTNNDYVPPVDHSYKFDPETTKSILAGMGINFGIYTFSYGFQYGNQDIGVPQIIDISFRLP